MNVSAPPSVYQVPGWTLNLSLCGVIEPMAKQGLHQLSSSLPVSPAASLLHWAHLPGRAWVQEYSLLSKEKLCSAEGICIAVFSCSNIPASFQVSSTLPLAMLTKPQVTSLCFCKLYPIKSCQPRSVVGRVLPYGLLK